MDKVLKDVNNTAMARGYEMQRIVYQHNLQLLRLLVVFWPGKAHTMEHVDVREEYYDTNRLLEDATELLRANQEALDELDCKKMC